MTKLSLKKTPPKRPRSTSLGKLPKHLRDYWRGMRLHAKSSDFVSLYIPEDELRIILISKDGESFGFHNVSHATTFLQGFLVGRAMATSKK